MSGNSDARPDEQALAAVSVAALRVDGGDRKQIEEHVASERTLVIVASNQNVARMQYLPGQEKELAAGFLVTEGLVEAGRLEIDVRPSQQLVTEAHVSPPVAPEKLEAFRTNATLASGCGAALAGLTIDPLDCGRRIDLSFRVASAVVSEAMRRLRRRSEVFRLTGGVHSASIVEGRGGEVAFADDIGRHNALDKVVGACVLRGIPLADKIALVSGRLSSELAAKCVRSGVALVASPGAPTDLALRIANATRLTLVGFARGDRMNVYSEDWRLA